MRSKLKASIGSACAELLASGFNSLNHRHIAFSPFIQEYKAMQQQRWRVLSKHRIYYQEKYIKGISLYFHRTSLIYSLTIWYSKNTLLWTEDCPSSLSTHKHAPSDWGGMQTLTQIPPGNHKKKKQMEKETLNKPMGRHVVKVWAQKKQRATATLEDGVSASFLKSMCIKEVIIYRGRNWKSRLLHDDCFCLEGIWKKRPMLWGRTGGSGLGARGAVQRTWWGGDSGSRGATGPPGRWPLIGWPCWAREAPVTCRWWQFGLVYLDGHRTTQVNQKFQ